MEIPANILSMAINDGNYNLEIFLNTYCFFNDVIGHMLLALVFGVNFFNPSNHSCKNKK
jgi:capsule polysaccharide modification protein KpsS